MLRSPRSPERAVGARSFWAAPRDLWRGLTWRAAGADLLAGLTVATVAIPQAIAYASIADLPAHVALWAAVVGGLVAALWSSSRHVSVGPTNSISLLTLTILLPVVQPGSAGYVAAAGLLALLAGLFLLAFAFLRLGGLVTIASRPVLLGFTAGAAVLIAAGQLRHLCGLELPSAPDLAGILRALWPALGGTSPVSLAFGGGAVVIIVALRLVDARMPGALLAVICAAALAALLGPESLGLRVVGEVPRALPAPLWSAAEVIDGALIRQLVTGAMAVAALSVVETFASAQLLAKKSGQRLDNDQQLFAQGLANLGAGLFSGYAVSGSLTRSALNHQAGARSQLAGVFTALAVLAGVLLFAPLAGTIPRAALAGVLLVIAWGMLDRRGIRRVLTTSRNEALVMLATFVATLLLPLEFAVLSGVLFSLAVFVVQSSLPRVQAVVPDPTYRHFVHDAKRPVCPQLGVMNIHGPLFFGAVHHVAEALRQNLEEHPGQSILLLRLHGVELCDLNGIEMLEETLATYRGMGGDLYIVRPRAPVLEEMTRSGFLDRLGLDHVLQQEEAIEHLFTRVLDPGVCIFECEQRVFAECHALPKHRYDAALPTYTREFHDPTRELAVIDCQRRLAAGQCAVIDVREPREFEAGHIGGALSVPLRQLVLRREELPLGRPLLLVCRSGRRSLRATAMLHGAGRDDVYSLKGGMLAWRGAGLPEVSGSLPAADAGALNTSETREARR